MPHDGPAAPPPEPHAPGEWAPIMADVTGVVDKLPAITLAFWIMKICATTLGEIAGDLLSMTLKVGYLASTAILLGVFAVALTAQLRAKRHLPFLYWFVILATSTAGTTMSDFMDRTLGLGYAMGSAILITGLITALVVWRLTEGSLSVTKVRSLRAESFYWGTILISNTLGTALGDYLADDSGLGFAGGALLISSLIVLIYGLYRMTNLSHTALFWAAFVLTRPFGATMGDLLTKPPHGGGIGLGTIGSSAALGTILVLVVHFAHRRPVPVPVPVEIPPS